jgi:hypothetical protein
LEATWEVFVVTWYVTGVAVPPKAPVQLAPAGVFTPEHGANVITPVVVFTVYVPCPGTTTDVAVHVGTDCPVPQSLTVEAVNVTPDAPTTSLLSGFTVCDAPERPVEVSAAVVGCGGGSTVGVYVAEPY